MRAGIGTRLTWGDQDFVVIAVDYRHAVLRSIVEDFVREVVVEELLRMPDIVWHDLRPPSHEPADVQLIAGLPEKERQVVEAWAEQLAIVKAAVEAGQDAAFLLEDVRVAMSGLVEVNSVETVRRKFQRFRSEGVLGLIDKRRYNGRKPSLDLRVASALSELGAAGVRRSSGTHGRTVDRVKWMLEEDFGEDIELPSDRTLYRRIAAHPTAGKLNSSAKSREVAANKPGRAFGMHGSLRPGEHVQIDGTVIDVPSRLLDGRLNRAELTIVHDVATRSILAAVVRAIATNSADLAGVLARALTPYDLRPPGAREQRERMAATWAGQFMIDQERLDRYRLAQPYIFPETITTENGKIFRSQAFRNGCSRLGISLIFAGRETPTDKPHVERTFKTMVTRFVQYLEGFTGGSVNRRGGDEPTDGVLAVAQLQELLEDWVAIEWQNRAHDGLADPLLPGRCLTPNDPLTRCSVHIVGSLRRFTCPSVSMISSACCLRKRARCRTTVSTTPAGSTDRTTSPSCAPLGPGERAPPGRARSATTRTTRSLSGSSMTESSSRSAPRPTCSTSPWAATSGARHAPPIRTPTGKCVRMRRTWPIG